MALGRDRSLRRSVFGILVLSLVLLVAAPAHAVPSVTISEDGMSRPDVRVRLGGTITWVNQLATDAHLVSFPLPYWSVDVPSGEIAGTTMSLAGSWNYRIESDPDVTGRIRVAPEVETTTVPEDEWFTLTASTGFIAPGYEYDILRRRPGVGTWRTVAAGIRSASFQVRMTVAGEYLWAIRTFGFNPDVGYDTFTPLSPRIRMTAT